MDSPEGQTDQINSTSVLGAYGEDALDGSSVQGLGRLDYAWPIVERSGKAMGLSVSLSIPLSILFVCEGSLRGRSDFCRLRRGGKEERRRGGGEARWYDCAGDGLEDVAFVRRNVEGAKCGEGSRQSMLYPVSYDVLDYWPIVGIWAAGLRDCWILGLRDYGIVGLLDGWMAGLLDFWITGSLDRWIGQFLRFSLWSKMRSGDLEEKGFGGGVCGGGSMKGRLQEDGNEFSALHRLRTGHTPSCSRGWLGGGGFSRQDVSQSKGLKSNSRLRLKLRLSRRAGPEVSTDQPFRTMRIFFTAYIFSSVRQDGRASLKEPLLPLNRMFLLRACGPVTSNYSRITFVFPLWPVRPPSHDLRVGEKRQLARIAATNPLEQSLKGC